MEPITELVQLSAGGNEPVSVATAKVWLRVETPDDDLLIGTLCSAARDYAERFCRRSFKVGDVYQLTMNCFPLAMVDGRLLLEDSLPEFWGTAAAFPYYNQQRFSVAVPRGPVTAINSITYFDGTNTQQTLDPSKYTLVQEDDASPRIYPAYPNWWPLTAIRPDAVAINYTAGAPLPPLVQVAMQQILAHWYVNREAVVITSATAQEVPMLATKLLWQYREMEF